MKASIPVLSTILLLWLVGGYFLYNNSTCCAPVAAATSGATTTEKLYITDGATEVAFANSSNLKFALSSSVPIMSSSVNNEFNKVVNYLKEHPDKLLLLTGLHKESEENDTESISLGISRAERLKAGLVKRGVPAEQIITDTEVVNDLEVNSEENRIIGGMKYYFKSKFLSLSDGADFNIGIEDNLNFEKDNQKYLSPLSDELLEYFSSVVGFLQDNSGKNLKLTGLFSADETNSSLLPNIGLARAQEVKRMLIDMGAAGNQIQTDANEISAGFFFENNLTGGVDFSLTDGEASDSEGEDSGYEESSFNVEDFDIKLYFESSQRNIDLSEDQRQSFASLINYLDDNPDAQIIVIGHTDNQGKEKSNIRLGRKRAEFVRDYIVDKGISKGQVITSSKGPDEPIATNSSEEGRAQNRRVEIKVDQ